MVKVIFVEANGTKTEVNARSGQVLMEAATKGGVAGIAADCGGNCACGTCRVYPELAWQGRLGEISAIEADMLEFSEDSQPGARLSCRIMVTEELEGLVVRLPENQHWG